MSISIPHFLASAAFVEGENLLQRPFNLEDRIHTSYFPEKLGFAPKSKVSQSRSIIGQKPLHRHSETRESSCSKSQGTSPEVLHIFVIGPSISGKWRLLDFVAGRNLGIPTEKNIYFAHNISGFMLQGVEVGINLWHVGNITKSLDILKGIYQKCGTCFMLVYDVNDSTSFNDVLVWIPNLKKTLDEDVPIVLVGYEDCKEPLTSKLSPVSYAEGMNAKTDYDLKTFYEFSDLTGSAVSDLIFEAAHIALESKVTISESESSDPEED